MSGAKSDAADAHTLADMVRTDAHQLRSVAADSPEARAIKVAVPHRRQPATASSTAPAQPGAARLVCLLPGSSVEFDLSISEQDRVVSGQVTKWIK